MATRTALLNGNVINRDTDFSKHIEAVSEPGIISGFAVSSSSVAVGQALVKCERTNGDTIYAVVYNNSTQEISGNGDVFIEIAQELIDNGELMNEDGSEIAEIKVGTMPAKNALKLATKSGSTVTDARNMIKKSGELLALINTNTANISSLDTRVGNLEEAEAINHLEVSDLVGELYASGDIMFQQYLSSATDSTQGLKIGDASSRKEIHIQRLGSGTASNQLKIKVKKTGSPTTGLVVEVRKGVKVTVTANSEAYWYGGEVIASGSISYSDITTSFATKTVTLNGNFGGTKGQLLDVVVYQTGGVVNSSNYYTIAYNENERSEGFGNVYVNGTTRSRGKYMVFCTSDGFSNSALAKWGIIKATAYSSTSTASGSKVSMFTANRDMAYTFTATMTAGTSQPSVTLELYVNDTVIDTYMWAGSSGTYTHTGTLFNGETIYVKLSTTSSNWTRSISLSVDVPKYPLSALPLKVNEVKAIGEVGYGNLYGKDGKSFQGGIMIGTSTGATTGSITLGNAVGYITVNLNGNIVKIPYYNN